MLVWDSKTETLEEQPEPQLPAKLYQQEPKVTRRTTSRGITVSRNFPAGENWAGKDIW